MGLADIRREYKLAALRRADLRSDPIEQFKFWFEQASGARASGRLRKRLIGIYKSMLMVSGTEPTEVNAMTLATVDKDGQPSARVVLLKGVDERGFLFYTNYESRKGRELAENPRVSLVFYWADQERQVCIAGQASRIPREESQHYFRSRPRGSRLGAWVSHQSQAVPGRKVLEELWRELEAKYPGDDIPMPPYWGGFVVQPERVEFWQGRPNRLHDRFCYSRQVNGLWELARLAP